jgi:hypothetical protein
VYWVVIVLLLPSIRARPLVAVQFIVRVFGGTALEIIFTRMSFPPWDTGVGRAKVTLEELKFTKTQVDIAAVALADTAESVRPPPPPAAAAQVGTPPATVRT